MVIKTGPQSLELHYGQCGDGGTKLVSSTPPKMGTLFVLFSVM